MTASSSSLLQSSQTCQPAPGVQIALLCSSAGHQWPVLHLTRGVPFADLPFVSLCWFMQGCEAAG